MQAEKYTKLSDLEHVLHRPDTFIGSLEKTTRACFLWEGTRARKIKQLESPGLCAIVDEILTNAQDRQYREELTRIEIECRAGERELSIKNDGKGIPIVETRIEAEGLTLWVPELVFGHFRAGSNFNDEEIRFCGGKNGLGASLSNAFSKCFRIEVGDSVNGKLYRQEWRDNMSVCGKPKITAYANKRGYVKVSFEPDWERFGYAASEGIPEALANYCAQRAYDAAACTASNVGIYHNGQRVPLKNFKQYCNAIMHSQLGLEADELPDAEGVETDGAYAFQTLSKDGVVRMELALAHSPRFEVIGFVNGLRCSRGKHIEHVTKLVCSALKAKCPSGVTSAQLKSHMLVICRAVIDNPNFESQTKESLSTLPSKFGFAFEVQERFVKRAQELGILNSAMASAELSSAKALKASSRTSRRVVLDKLDNAFDAHLVDNGCSLILTEGDSAKELALTGLSVIGRQKFGVYPLIGKILNPRDCSAEEIMASPISMNLIRAIGLEYGKVYDAKSMQRLHYPHRLIAMADQDYDGDHIVCLIYNWIASLFPSILRVNPHYVARFITPIVSLTWRSEPLYFFSEAEFELWRKGLSATQNASLVWLWLKGLSSSTNRDAQRYFSNLAQHLILLEHDANADATLALAFAKSQSEQRKVWLTSYDREAYLDYGGGKIEISRFIDVALRGFAQQDCIRSLPDLDGFKPSQRKILFAMLDNDKLGNCADLQGDIGRRTAYHHNRDALYHALVHMAQLHWGSNNINLIHGNGQFGSRLSSKYGQARYLFAKIEPIARFIFPELDDPILETQVVDGMRIEPKLYQGVLPWLLVNGSQGIGTGWSTNIPPHHPLHLAAYLCAKLEQRPYTEPLEPWIDQFKGSIVKVAHGWDARGLMQCDGDRVLITELAPGYTKNDYITFLEGCRVRKEKESEPKRAKLVQFVLDIDDQSSHTEIKIQLQVDRTAASQLGKPLAELLHLQNCKQSQISGRNFVVIHEGKPQRYESAEQLIEAYFPLRLEAYRARLVHLVESWTQKIEVLLERHRFITLVRQKTIQLSLAKAKLRAQLAELGFSDAKTLLSMSCGSFTVEKLAKLEREIGIHQARLEELQQQTPEREWLADLAQFQAAYPKFLERKRAVLAPSDDLIKAKPVRKAKTTRGRK